MSVYSYVELKVHTNVRKVGTHLNVCFTYRTYVRWKYTFMFVRAFYISIYNEHMFERRYTYTIFAPPLSYPLLYYIYIQKEETLFPAHSLPFPPLSYLFFVYSFIIYSIYREGIHFPATFYPFPHSFIILLLYIEEGTLCPPFFAPLIKWTPLHRHFLYLFEMLLMGKVCGEKFLKTLLV